MHCRYSKLQQLKNKTIILLIVGIVGSPVVCAAPEDIVISYDKHMILLCDEEIDANLKPIRTAPGLLDYCNNIKLNTKHYSSQDNKLRQQCDSKSVFRVVSQINDIDENGLCIANAINWYCDPIDKVVDAALPMDSYYCPSKLPNDYIAENALICPDTRHLSDNLKLLIGGIDESSFYCDNIDIDTVHYVLADQKLANYSQEDIEQIKVKQIVGRDLNVCSSKSAYRVITYKGQPDANGKCSVTYDVYCDSQLNTITPYKSRKCPSITRKPFLDIQGVKTEAPNHWEDFYRDYNIEPDEPIGNIIDDQTTAQQPLQQQGHKLQQQGCGQVPVCNSGGQGGCPQYQYLPYTGYYVTQCQQNNTCGNKDGNFDNNGALISDGTVVDDGAASGVITNN